jgi:hypothetical protein
VRLVVGHHQEIARADVQRLAAVYQPRLAAAGDQPVKENRVLAIGTDELVPSRTRADAPRLREFGREKNRARKAQHVQDV